MSTAAPRTDLRMPPRRRRHKQMRVSTPQPGHTMKGVRHPCIMTSPPHRYRHEVPWYTPQPSSSLESGQSGWPSQNHVCGMQELPSEQRSSPFRQGWLLQFRTFLSMPSGQSSMLSQEQGLPVGCGHCPSWAHGSISGVQGQSGPKCSHNSAQVLHTAHLSASPAFQGQWTL